jgi:hypothetical protein
MRLPRRLAYLAASAVLIAAACSSSATPAVVYVTPTPGQPATPAATAIATQASAPAPTPAPPAPATPVPTAASTATPPPLSSIHLLSLGIVSPLPISLQDYILYQISVPMAEDSFQPQAWVVKGDGTGNKLIIKGDQVGPLSPPRYNLDTVWALDGYPIHVMRTCTPKLSDIAVGGSWVATGKAQMTNKDWGFLWSPNDGQVAYLHFNASDTICEHNGMEMTRDLMVMKPDGTGKKVLVHNFEEDATPTAWTPDGAYLLNRNATGNWQLINASTGAISPLGFHGTKAKLSRDGSRVAWLDAGTLHVRPTGGGTTKNFANAEDFAWSPNGNSLAIATTTKLGVISSNTGVGQWIYNFKVTHPSWSPDGKSVVCLRSGVGIFIVPISGAAAKAVPNTSKAYTVSWQP